MAFTINETGIESGATKVVFASPVIINERDEETAADAVYDVSLTGAPVVVVYNRTQAKTFLRLYVRLIKDTDLTNLRTLMASGDIMTVKLTPGSSTTIQCMFGPRSEQKLTPWNGPHPDAKGDGDPIDGLLLQYKAELMLLRLS
jgi:hypothetical protein